MCTRADYIKNRTAMALEWRLGETEMVERGLVSDIRRMGLQLCFELEIPRY